MVAKELDIPLDLKKFEELDQLNQELGKINPFQTVPTIVDHDNDGFILWESRAIMTYLVDQYSPGHFLYPTDPKKRAEIDMFLFMDLGTIYKTLLDWLYTILEKGSEVNEEWIKSKANLFQEKLALLDGLIGSSQYVTGETLTLADFALLSTLSIVKDAIDFDISQHENLTRWADDLKASLPYYQEVNKEPIEELISIISMQIHIIGAELSKPAPFDP